MVLHNPPAPSGSNFTGECDRRTSRDRSRSSQSGDKIFIDETKKTFILFTTILCASAQRARGQKWVFEVMARAFFVAASSKRSVLTPATRRYSFCRDPSSPHCVLAWSRTRGRSAIVAMVSYDREVGCACLIFLRRVLIIVNTSGKKDLCKNYNTS